ncbi:MAG: ArsR family transcriptional regulator [Blastocatellia bacterium]|nr:ArsR family transcriptional regulator [Blastocatellia bacterium]
MAKLTSNLLKEKRCEIVNLLKAQGAMTVDALAAELKLTKVSIRRHLELLEKEELVSFRTEWQERGRPHHVYSLTAKAESLFPKTYDVFARDMLRITQQCFGERGVLKVLSTRADEMVATLKPHLEGLGFDERVEKLAVLLIERGYLAECQRMPDGSYMLIERNCPTINVAYEFNQVCQQEKRLYAEVLGCDVIREQRIASGDQVCAYRVLKPIELQKRIEPETKSA